jgi:hypothetical protein
MIQFASRHPSPNRSSMMRRTAVASAWRMGRVMRRPFSRSEIALKWQM